MRRYPFISRGAVRAVSRRVGAVALSQDNPDGARKALKASGFGFGQHYETKGFGAG